MEPLTAYLYKVSGHDGTYWAFLYTDKDVKVFGCDRNLRACARDAVGTSQKHDREIRRVFSTPPVGLLDEIAGSVHHREDWVPLALSEREISRYNREIDRALRGD